jgi:orotidine-5'-phosphate decarboxylase
MRNFKHLQTARWEKGKFVCVGLDSDYRRVPQFLKDRHKKAGATLVAFNKAIIDATSAVAGTYKFQSSFYEAEGTEGIEALQETVAYAHKKAPEVPLIIDAKRADIGSSNEGYTQTVFDHWKFDAVTVHPYLGGEALKPFLERTEKGIIVLCKTSNPGSGEFQNQTVTIQKEEMPLYLWVAKQVANEWNTAGNCSLVVGATYPEEATKIRAIVGDMTFLIPGIGAQGGDLAATVAACKNSQGTGMIINSSRGIIFASEGEDFAECAGQEAKSLNELIAKYAGQ